MVATTLQKMTVEEFLQLPEDGVRRSLINGIVREYGMTIRNRFHSAAMSRVAHYLITWVDAQPEPRGGVISGEAGVELVRGTVVGVDVAYVAPEVMADQRANSTIIQGIPAVIAEIRSPSDTDDAVDEKVALYLSMGVPVIWVVSPRHQTVTIFRPGHRPTLANADQELTAESVLPGFRVAVADLFR